MDGMLSQRDNFNKNLKDNLENSTKDISFSSVPYKAENFYLKYYTKINKLITALYMVTDNIDKEEPIRLKLRTLGVEIISDVSMLNGVFGIEKIDKILSFLNIAFDINMISEMNSNILKKEFIMLKDSIQKSMAYKNTWLEEFLLDSKSNGQNDLSFDKGQKLSNNQTSSRIGIQKGSTLLKALDKVQEMKVLNNIENMSFLKKVSEKRYILKNKKRELILKILNTKSTGMSIKDISLEFKNLGENIKDKTLQRELFSMVKDNVLKKTGEKRWSQYFLQ